MAKTRTRKLLIRQFSAGGVVYRADPSMDSGILWLIIKPHGKDQWRLPKGLIDDRETSLEAASREVEEEAGIETEILGKIGQDKYFYQMGGERYYKIVTYFLMRYLQDAKGPVSWETEEIAWLPYEEALEKLTFQGEKGIFKIAQEMTKDAFDKAG